MVKRLLSIMITALLSGCSAMHAADGASGATGAAPVSRTTDFALSTLQVSGSQIADSSTPLTVTVTLKNADGTFEPGFVPTWTSSDAGVIAGICTASDANGISTCPVKASFAGAKTFVLTNAKVGLSTPLTYTASSGTQGSNLLVNANDFTQSSWSQYSITVSNAPAVVAPDGSATTNQLTDTATNNVHGISQTVTLAAGTYTESMFIKAGTYSGVSIRATDASDFTEAHREFVLGTATPAYTSTNLGTNITLISTTMTPYTDGWYRYTSTFSIANSASFYARLFIRNPTTDLFTGSGTDFIYFWMPKLEVGASATAPN